MTEQHPITPPPELVQQWYNECPEANEACLPYVTTQAARWGADQELEACRLWVSENHSIYDAKELKLARRPKPLSLKQQALLLCNDYIDPEGIIRRALEQLDD